jgi:predicted small integral membrane protein
MLGDDCAPALDLHKAAVLRCEIECWQVGLAAGALADFGVDRLGTSYANRLFVSVLTSCRTCS